MTRSATEGIRAWQQLADTVAEAIDGLSDAELDLRPEAAGFSIREFVHHIVESNLVASNIVLAALAKNGMVYDWSWVMPNLAWVQRLGYRQLPVQPALSLLRALTQYYGEVIQATADGLTREVQLLDSPDAALYSKTVAGLLEQEIAHAHGHLNDIAQIRALHAV